MKLVNDLAKLGFGRPSASQHENGKTKRNYKPTRFLRTVKRGTFRADPPFPSGFFTNLNENLPYIYIYIYIYMGGCKTPPSLFCTKGPGSRDGRHKIGARVPGRSPATVPGRSPGTVPGRSPSTVPNLIKMSLRPQINVRRVPGRSGRVPGRSSVTGIDLWSRRVVESTRPKNCCRNILPKKSPKSSNSEDRPATVPGRSEHSE